MSDVVEVVARAFMFPHLAESDRLQVWNVMDAPAKERACREVRAALSVLAKEGWVVGPLEPTREMETPAIEIIRDNDGGYNNVTAARHATAIYKATISSRPVGDGGDEI